MVPHKNLNYERFRVLTQNDKKRLSSCDSPDAHGSRPYSLENLKTPLWHAVSSRIFVDNVASIIVVPTAVSAS